MSDSKNPNVVSRSKSVQPDINVRASSVAQALSLKNRDVFSEPFKNWLSNGRQDSLEKEKSERESEHSLDTFLKPSRSSRGPFDLKSSLSDGPYINQGSASSILRSSSVKSLDIPISQCNDFLSNIDTPLASSLSTQSDHVHSTRFSLNSKLSLAKNSSLFSSPQVIGTKSPHRRTTVSDGHLRSSIPSNSEAMLAQESQKCESLSSRLSTVLPAPAPAMYWRKIVDRGERPPHPLRAHSSTLVGDQIFIFGGCNTQACYNDVFIFDTDTMYWSRPQTTGTPPSPRRAHSATLVDGLGLFIFGGGNSSNYYNDLHVLDTVTLTWSSPPTYGDAPTPRRAHSTCFYKNALYVFGGGDGVYPLNDLFRLDLTTNNGYRWSKIEPEGIAPTCRGYHSATLLDGGHLIIYGGSDGTECFDDMFLLDLDTHEWKEVPLNNRLPRLAHSTTQIGTFLYIVGGRNKRSYVDDLMVFNLHKGSWEVRKVFGNAPSPRGYHTTILHDARLFSFGGYDGLKFYGDMHVLDLSASAYMVQIRPFKLKF